MNKSKFWKINTVGRRFLVSNIIMTVLLFGCFSIVLVRSNNSFVHKMMDHRGEALVLILEQMSQRAIMNNDLVSLDTLCKQVMADPEIVYAAFYDRNNKYLGLQRDKTAELDASRSVVYQRELKQEGQLLGHVRLYYHRDLLTQNIYRGIYNVGLGLVVIVLLFILGTIVFTHGVTGPLNRLVEVVEHISIGDLSLKATIERDDEVGNLGRQINAMIDSLKKMIGSIRQTSTDVSISAEQVASISESIASGAQQQAGAAEETSSSMEEMSVNIQSVATNITNLASNVEETTSFIQQIGTSAGMVMRSSESVAANVAETSSTIEQMIVTMENINKNIGQSDKLAQQASNEAQEGGQAVLKTVEGMKNIGEMMRNISSVIRDLGKRSESIGGIIGVIEEIADQTNLLALNAAIEAARAGDAGRGFAVVADEVRKLAERSIKATKEIADVIKEVQKETSSAVNVSDEGARFSEEGINMADQAGSAINTIQTAITSVSVLLGDIAMSATEQSTAANNVVKSVEEMNHLTQSVNESIKEQTAGIQRVVQIVEDMAMMTDLVKNATHEQKEGGTNVVQSVENISSIAKANLEAVQKLARASQDMASLSDGLQQLVGEFRFE
ncbi:HAMP domain-containing protein [bacterium]|nr:HAMP domain-containing protein [bacterium]